MPMYAFAVLTSEELTYSDERASATHSIAIETISEAAIDPKGELIGPLHRPLGFPLVVDGALPMPGW